MRKWLFGILMIASTLFLVELTSYVYIRLYVPEINYFRSAYLSEKQIQNASLNIQPQPYLNYTPTPGLTRDNIEDHNEDGYRGKKVPVSKDSCIRILAMGGSTTYGFGVKHYQDAYPALLEKYLHHQKRDACFEVINAGLNSGTSAELLTHYLFKFRYYRPDVLILNTGGNDADAYRTGQYQPDMSNWRSNMVTLPSSTPLLRTLLRSRFFSIIFCHFLFPESINGQQVIHNGDDYAKWFDRNLNPEVNMQFNAFHNNISTVVREARQRNMAILLVSFQSDPKDTSVATFRPYYKLHETILDSIAQEYSIHSLHFPSDQITPEYWVDHCHLNKEGNQQKAELLGEYLMEMLFAKPQITTDTAQ